MKVKLDENLGNRSIELFREAGHDVATVSGQDLGGTSDDRLIEVCRTERRVLVTLDLDFSNVLRFPPERYAGIVVLRVPHPIELEAIRERVRTLLQASEREELSGQLWIIERDRIREYAPKQGTEKPEYLTTTEINGLRILKDRAPTPTGEMLLQEFLKPLGMTQTELATRIRVPYVRVNEVVNGKRHITPSTTLRLAKALGTSPEFWLNGQLALDLHHTIHDEKEIGELERIEPVPR